MVISETFGIKRPYIKRKKYAEEVPRAIKTSIFVLFALSAWYEFYKI
jgi:hypothetical protein